MNTAKHRTTLHTFSDGRTIRIVLNRRLDAGEPIIHELTWHRGGGAYPLNMLGILIGEIEALAREEWLTFSQSMRFPGLPELRFAFSSGKPAVSVSTEVLPPRQKTPEELRVELRAALAKHITPDELANAFASLPVESQRVIGAKFLITPPVRRTTRFNRRRKP